MPWRRPAPIADLDALCRPHTKAGRNYARFNPLTPADLALFRAVLSGKPAINGFKNRDLARRPYRRPPHDPDEAHRRCERVSRLIVKLRGHGLVAKVPRSRLYRVARYGIGSSPQPWPSTTTATPADISLPPEHQAPLSLATRKSWADRFYRRRRASAHGLRPTDRTKCAYRRISAGVARPDKASVASYALEGNLVARVGAAAGAFRRRQGLSTRPATDDAS
jgi:hypothetical protein